MQKLILAALLLVLSILHLPAQTNSDWSNYDFNLPSKNSPDVQWWRDSRMNLDERLAWWRDARFGMFMHWGVYSYAGGTWQGKPVRGYAEHIQRIMKIPGPVYRRDLAGHFDPTNFDADTWVRLAKAAGMKYIVITAKHHDGFAMWPTKVNDYNVMDATPWHHDPMKDLKAACKKFGLKFGFYYSQAYDWTDANAPGNDWDRDNPGGDKRIGGVDWWTTRPEFMNQARRYVDEKAIPQLLELIRVYQPDILWFDTAGKLPPSENLRIMKAVRQADPNVVISGRLVHDWGDYADTTDRPANFPPFAGDWEGIPTTDESYGWNQNDFSYKPPSHFIQLLAKAAARGGNVLLNIGPMGNGDFDPHDVAILQGIANWWSVNGQSIRGTSRTPLPVQTWGESTRKGSILYLHVFNWPASGRLDIGGLISDISSAQLLADKSAELGSERINSFDMEIDGLPAAAPDKADSVIEIKCDGEIQTDTNRLLQPQFLVDTLRAFDGVLHGKLRYGPGKKTDDYVMDWTSGKSISWPVRLNEPAKYEVLINYVATDGSTGGTYAVKLGGQTLNGVVKAGDPQIESLGTVSLEPGAFEISVSPVQITGNELFRLRSVTLKALKR
ncbi:MAG TPA: alpha-L-fucosidase [Verrucomicrobiae bacterium]|nr:alpha-L-fucosidase [Verrucomicrobiae bacterium]